MSDIAFAQTIPLRVRNPLRFTCGVASFLGIFGAMLHAIYDPGASALEPWRIGVLLATLTFWASPMLEACSIAHDRSRGSLASVLAYVFGYGYFWTIAVLLMQWGREPLLVNWGLFGISGVLFGLLLARNESRGKGLPADGFFQETHALHRSIPVRMLFVLWPFATIVGLTHLIANPPIGGWSPMYVPTLMLLCVTIWPLSFDVTPNYRKTYLSLIGLGAVGLAIAFLVPL